MVVKMTNTKTRKSGKTSENTLSNATDAEGVDELDGNGRHWFQGGSGGNMLSDDTEVDNENCINDSDTGTSFSLEECMNEFRARRNRRISSHNRQEADRDRDENDCHDVTEMDLINQNMCNKEQERKCKPCKDGFCYCFTSDSGDGAGSVVGLAACRASRANLVRQSRRYRRSVYDQAPEDTKQHCDPLEAIIGKTLPNNAQTQRNTEVVGKNNLTAISRLETSHKDAPLIHIIQELRDNCVISEVRVNTEKLKKNQHLERCPRNTDSKLKASHNIQKASSKGVSIESQEPTAPAWENGPELNMPQSDCLLSSPLENICSKRTGHSKGRNIAGGRLLQKRLSNPNFSYKPTYKKVPPPKPPRSSLSFEEISSTSTASTSLSVREAEHVVDKFLAENGHTISKDKSPWTNFKSRINTELSKESYINQEKWNTEKVSRDTRKDTHHHLKDIESVIESKQPSNYEKNIKKISKNQSKVFRIGWKEPRINYMLNYDSNNSRKQFETRSTQAEPQHCWQIPPKIYLDTVDGEVHHNLSSNVKNKDTPVKTRQSGMPKITSQTQRVVWSEQLRNLSPWSNKQNPKSNLRSSSTAFLKSSRKKILRLVSPKKENKERFNFQIRKTPHRHVAIQTSRDDLSPHQYPESPPGIYHSPVQSSQQQSLDMTNNTTADDIEPGQQHFDFSRHIHSPLSKAVRDSKRKLNFPLNCTEYCSGARNVSSPPPSEMKTYRSFNGVLDQYSSHSKMNYILSNIRAKLEANDDLAVQTFRIHTSSPLVLRLVLELPATTIAAVQPFNK